MEESLLKMLSVLRLVLLVICQGADVCLNHAVGQHASLGAENYIVLLCCVVYQTVY